MCEYYFTKNEKYTMFPELRRLLVGIIIYKINYK